MAAMTGGSTWVLMAVVLTVLSALGGWAAEATPGEAPMDPRDNTEAGKRIHQELERKNEEQQAEALFFAKGNGLRVIMLGNSWTRPAVEALPEVAAAAGFDGQHIRACTPGSQKGHADPLFHSPLARSSVFPALETGQWDAMTILSRWNDKPEHFAQWIDLGMQANPGMTFYVQTAWAYLSKESLKAPHEAQKVIAQLEASLAKQQAEYQANYEALIATYPGKVHLIPCGDAVLEMVRRYYAGQLPGYDCLTQATGGMKGVFLDGGHLGHDLRYLLGYLFYATLYRASPERIQGFAPAGVDPGVDRIMRSVAWRAVLADPRSGVVETGGTPGQVDPARP